MSRKKSGYLWLGISFLFPILGLLSFFIIHKIIPFGDNSFLIHDMNYQYADFFAYMRSVLQGKNDTIYSLSRGLGGDFYSFFAYYLISPLNLIPVLFPDRLMPLGISIEMLICFGLAGAACYSGLKHFVPDNSPLTLIYFSTAYSLSGWFLLNAENFQFLPTAVLLPLLVAEWNRMKETGKTACFILLLVLSVLLNFYIGYMAALFVFLWTLSGDGRRTSMKMWLAFALAGLICFPFIYPVLKQLILSVKSTDPFWYVPKWNFTILQYLRKTLPGQFDAAQYMDNGLPPVYCGLIAPLLSILFFFRGHFDQRKRQRLILFSVLFLSMFFRPLTMIWQGFSLPRWWPYRFAFLFIFLLVLTAAESRIRLPFWLLLIGYAGLLFNMDRTLSVKIENAVPVSRFAADTAEKQARISEIKAKDGELYRIEDLYPRSDNDPMHFSYPGITHFDSLARRSTVEFLRRLGYPNNRYTVSYGHGNTRFSNALLGVRYVLDRNSIITNAPSVGLAFMADAEIFSEALDIEDPLLFQNTLAGYLGIADPILKEFEPAASDFENIECDQVFCWKKEAADPAYLRYTFKSDRQQLLYARMDSRKSIGTLYFLNGEEKIPYDDTEYFIPLGMILPGEEKIVTVEADDPILDIPDITFICEDQAAVQEFADRAFQGISCIKESSSEIGITFPETKDRSNLIVTVPYDPRWRAVSDAGEKLTIISVWDTFLAVQIPEKTAGIRLSYR